MLSKTIARTIEATSVKRQQRLALMHRGLVNSYSYSNSYSNCNCKSGIAAATMVANRCYVSTSSDPSSSLHKISGVGGEGGLSADVPPKSPPTTTSPSPTTTITPPPTTAGGIAISLSPSPKSGQQQPSPSGRRGHKLTTLDIQHMQRKGKKLSMLTAYDYPTGMHAEMAGFEMILVGDSLGMVVLGYDTTQPVTLEDMIHHSKAVRRGAPTSFVVGDMPFGSYEVSNAEALRNAYRLMKEGHVDAVKVEGGRNRIDVVSKLIDGGVAVMGHIGLTPQSVSVLGGFRAQGRTALKARQLLDDALALQKAGAFAIVLECVPAIVAKVITDNLSIPTIGIGAGPHTTGQVLVYHDLLGVIHHPHFAKHVPSFCKRYANLGHQIHEALCEFRSEVQQSKFPDIENYSPYKMSDVESAKFMELLKPDAVDRTIENKQTTKKLKESDEYEVTKLY